MRMKKVAKRLLRGAISVALTMAMAVGIFAGTGMDVRAAVKDYYFWIDGSVLTLRISDETVATEVKKGKTTIDIPEYSSYFSLNGYMICDFGGGDIIDMGENGVADVNYDTSHAGKWKVTDYTIEDYSGKYCDKKVTVTFKKVESQPTTPASSPSATGQSDNEASQKEAQKQPAAPHTHSYSWVTVQDVTAEQDGIEEYRCSCGDVQGRNVIPASTAAVKGLCDAAGNAPQNGTVIFDTGRLYTISDYVIKKLAERTDVTTVIMFEYQNQAYKMTIPAGADYTRLLTDENDFYGYFYFTDAVGAVIEAL